MLNEKTFLAIIPARGGSKRLPRKNALDLAGKPLIAWTIEAGLASQYIDNVIVSSEDEEILEIANQWGISAIKRPIELASDTATTFDAVKHAIENCEGYDYIVLLQPTSPLRNARHIDEAIEMLQCKNAEAIISVCEMDHSPLWSNTIPEDGCMRSFIRDEMEKRSQDLPQYYRLNGAIYLLATDVLLEYKSLFNAAMKVYSYKMMVECSVDIDNLIDFKLAEIIIQQQ